MNLFKVQKFKVQGWNAEPPDTLNSNIELLNR